MKIGILADTHDNMPAIRKALEAFRARGAETVIHAGDVVAPFAAKALARFEGPVYAVYGNNDGEREGLARALDIAAPPRIVELGGRRLVVAHDASQVADPPDADIVVTGHTHAVEISPGRPLGLNPGEAGGWLTGRSTCVVLDLETMEAEVCELA